MDRVTKSYLDDFLSEQSLQATDDSEAFEKFSAYCVISDAFDDEFDVNDVHVGGAGDLGLDAIGIIVNGCLVTSAEEVQDLLKVNGYLDVTFIFVQAKTSSGFDGAEMAEFMSGVHDFFADSIDVAINAEVQNARIVMHEIYSHSVSFRRQKPTCLMFYVTTGQWKNDTYLVSKINRGVEALRSTAVFSETSCTPMGADEIQQSYQRSKNNVTAEFIFSTKVLLPEIPGIQESYLGVLPAQEFLRLLEDQSGNIRGSLFYDNVRDFQDYNQVNQEIQSTLQEEESQGRFAVLNNGVTVVARALQTTGNKFVLSDYQIVNGCQTSHVLFNERAALNEAVFVPLKVVVTGDEEIVNAIITATNRQTQVSTEDLYALAGFQKKLEALFGSYPDKRRLYYERRSKQYNAAAGIEKVRIIQKAQQIRAFAAMFLDDPHRASRYYAELRSQVGERIFGDGHRLEPYYAAAYAHYKLEFLFRNGALPVKFKPARYHLLMAFRYEVAGAEMPAMTANKMEGYSEKICNVLWDDSAAQRAFIKCTKYVEKASGQGALTRDTVKTQSFTDAVKVTMGVKSKAAAAAADR